MSMKPQLSLGPLPMSEKYSDLTLICQGRAFKVHKSVVCVQSSVIAAACDGPYKESQTNVIKIKNFDWDTVERMVQYLYQKRYTVNIDDYPDVEDDGEDGNSEDSQAKANRNLDTVLQEAGRDDGNGDAKPAQDEFIPLEQNLALVLLHVHVNGIADYYDIPGLKDMANRNIKRILNKIEALDGFTDIIEETLNYTNDPDLHQIIAECAAMHITDLVETKDFFEKGAITQFPAAIINVMAQTYPKAIVKLEKSLADAQSEAEQMRTELRDLNQRINNLMHHTQRIRRCRNRDLSVQTPKEKSPAT